MLKKIPFDYGDGMKNDLIIVACDKCGEEIKDDSESQLVEINKKQYEVCLKCFDKMVK